MFPYEAGGSGQPDGSAHHSKGAAQRFREADLPLEKLWMYYYGIGGDIDEMSLDAFLHDALDIPAAQVELISAAMTEMAEGDAP